MRKRHFTWNFAVPVAHSEEIRRCILLFLCTLGIMHDEAACHADLFFYLHDLGHEYLSPMSALDFANNNYYNSLLLWFLICNCAQGATAAGSNPAVLLILSKKKKKKKKARRIDFLAHEQDFGRTSLNWHSMLEGGGVAGRLAGSSSDSDPQWLNIHTTYFIASRFSAMWPCVHKAWCSETGSLWRHIMHLSFMLSCDLREPAKKKGFLAPGCTVYSFKLLGQWNWLTEVIWCKFD